MPNFFPKRYIDLSEEEKAYKRSKLANLEAEYGRRGLFSWILFILSLICPILFIFLLFRLNNSSTIKREILTLKKELNIS